MNEEKYEDFLASDTWKEIRHRALRRADFRCELCNSPHDLHVHHRTYERIGGDEHDGDLTTLCRECHTVFHVALRLRGIMPPSEYVGAVAAVIMDSSSRQEAFERGRLLLANWPDVPERAEALRLFANRLDLPSVRLDEAV